MTNPTPQFRAAERSDFPELISLWQESFNVTRKASEHVFSLLQNPECIFVLADKNGIAAMLSVRGFSLESQDGSCKAAYIYGVAASPKSRGRGFGTLVLSNADTVLSQCGYACAVLVPASESLFGYYAKRGYNTAFSINKAELAGAELKPGPVYKLKKIGGGELALMRDEKLGGSGIFARWDVGYLDYIAAESEFYGGGVYAADIEGSQACAVCHKSGDTVYIKELCVSSHALEAAIRSVHAHFGAKKYLIYLREDVKTPYTNNLLPFAMIKWYDKKTEEKLISAKSNIRTGAPPYIAHVLD